MTIRQTIPLTVEGYEKLKSELKDLVTVKRPEVADLLHFVAEDGGDLNENVAYAEAKKEQAFVEGRIQEIQDILSEIEIIDRRSNKSGAIRLGSKVTIQEEGKDPEVYLLVGSVEANPCEGRISHVSPLGQALIEREVGEEIAVKAPDGQLIFMIKSVC